MTVGNTPIIAPAIITSLFIIFVYVQRTQIYNDALTGLNNRKRLFFMLETKIPQADKEHPDDPLSLRCKPVSNRLMTSMVMQKEKKLLYPACRIYRLYVSG